MGMVAVPSCGVNNHTISMIPLMVCSGKLIIPIRDQE